MTKQRRRMKKFRIKEISAVDRPAQEAALALLMKSDGTSFYKTHPHDKILDTTLELEPVTKKPTKPADDVRMSEDDDGNTVLEKPKRKKTQKEDDFSERLPSSFQAAIKSIRARDPKLTHTAAMSAARKQFPNLFDDYQNEGRALAAKSLAPPAPVAKSAAVVAFEKRIDEVQALEKCSRVEALKRAAREFPTELEAYRGALA